jgi:CDP-diglyceride synthetase
MKRPGVVWVYTIFVVIGILINLISSIFLLGKGKMMVPATAYYAAIITIILIIPQIIFIGYFFMLKKKSLLWLYITFGAWAVLSLIGMRWFSVLVIILVGWVIWDYITKKKIDGQPVFT